MTQNKEEHDGIKVGDIITAYHKGYHRVVGFHDLEYDSKQVHSKQVDYQPVLNSAGKPKGGEPKCCHIDYCTVIDEAAVLVQFHAEKQAAEKKRDAVLSILTRGDSDEA